MISIDGKPMLATHWDGYPSSLGVDLLECDKSIKAIIGVAKRHTIDAAHSSLREELNNERVKELATKQRLTEAEIRKGKRRGSVICADDYQIGDIDDYGDWAQYQYDIRGKEIYFRPLNKWWPGSLRNAPEFTILTMKRANDD